MQKKPCACARAPGCGCVCVRVPDLALLSLLPKRPFSAETLPETGAFREKEDERERLSIVAPLRRSDRLPCPSILKPRRCFVRLAADFISAIDRHEIPFVGAGLPSIVKEVGQQR